MSKGFDMIGWRIGWVCGHERIVGAFADVKDNSDSGQFIAIQKAAVAGLDDPEIPKPHAHQIQAPPRKAGRHAQRCGFKCKMPGGTYFLYTPAPKGFANGGPGGGADQLRKRRSRQPVPDHRAIDLHRALGRRRPVPALQRHLRSRRRSGRRRPDGRDRSSGSKTSSRCFEVRQAFQLAQRVAVAT